MKKRLKLLASLSTFCLAIAVLCFGVFAAIKVTYTISGSISYDVNDAYVKINTTVYASTKVLTQEQVEQYTLDFVTTDPTTVEGITLVNDNVEEYNSTSATTEPATGEVETGNLTGGSTYFFKVNIQNLSTNEVSASAKAESEMTIPTNMYQFNSGAVTEITTEGKNIVIALSVENPAQALDEVAYNIGINVNAGDEQTLSQLSLTPITETTEATYNVQNSTAPVSGYSVSATDTDIQGLDGVLNVPTYVDGLPILQVEERAFANCTNLTHILIPTTVQEMGAECFAGCASLTELTILFIGRVNYETQEQASEDADISTFYHFFDTVEFEGSITCGTGYDNYTCYLPNILTINVLNGCNIIPDFAFYDDDCMAITIQTVNLPLSLTYLGKFSFAGCVSLETVNIPQNTNIDTLKEWVFSGCESLKNFVIPSSVKSIENNALSYCTSLTEIEIPNTVTSIGYAAFYWCSSLKEITIPSSLTNIGNSAFDNTPWLDNLTANVNGFKIVEASDNTNVKYLIKAVNESLPQDGVITEQMLMGLNIIAGGAFESCSNLTGITLPNSIETIEEYTFRYCNNLKNISIPSSVTIIKYFAFDDCSSLSKLTFMHTTGSIEIEIFAFSGIKSGAVATFASSSTKWTSEGTTYTGSTALTNLHSTTSGTTKTWTIS